MKIRVRLIVLLFAMLMCVAPGRTAAQDAPLCFAHVPGIRHCIEGRFREYWEQNGGLAVFGYPMSAAANQLNRDTGQTYLTQHFERNRFELHTEERRPYDVLLGRLGDDLLIARGRRWQNEPRESGERPGCLWFSETGHNVCNQEGGLGFRAYWESHGLKDPQLDAKRQSLALFGLPLTEPRQETNSSGDTVLTQWFERARFEWHPNNPSEYRVLLGLLGNEQPSEPPRVARIPIPDDDLRRLNPVLRDYGLTVQSLNLAQTVSFVLPPDMADPAMRPTVVQSAALLKPSPRGVLGILNAERSLPLPSGELPADIYLVRVEQGRIHFVGSNGKEPVPSLTPIARLSRTPADTLQTSVSSEFVCWETATVEYCSPPSPNGALTGAERGRLSETTQASVERLQSAGIIDSGEIDTGKATPVAEGNVSAQRNEPSLLAAPITSYPSDSGLLNGAVIGAVRVRLATNIQDVTVKPGSYAVRTVQAGQAGWKVRFDGFEEGGSNRVEIDASAQVFSLDDDVSGLPDEPYVSLDSVCWTIPVIETKICVPPRRR